MTREDLKDLITMICNEEYEYIGYKDEKTRAREMADIANKNELKRRIDIFLDEFTSEEYKINEEFCKETMTMMRQFIGHTDNRINVLQKQKEAAYRKGKKIGRNKTIEEILPSAIDLHDLCREDALTDFVNKLKQMKE